MKTQVHSSGFPASLVIGRFLYIQKDGRMDYQQGQDIIDQVGKSIKVTGPSDDVPRYRLKK